MRSNSLAPKKETFVSQKGGVDTTVIETCHIMDEFKTKKTKRKLKFFISI